jgi:hypothetical protein
VAFSTDNLYQLPYHIASLSNLEHLSVQLGSMPSLNGDEMKDFAQIFRPKGLRSLRLHCMSNYDSVIKNISPKSGNHKKATIFHPPIL